MLADALTKALGGVKLGEFVEEIGLGYDHGQDFGFPLFQIVYLDLHCVLGFSLDLGLIGFGTRRRILGFRLFVLLILFRPESLGPKGEC